MRPYQSDTTKAPRSGTQQRIATLLRVDRSTVSKIARGVYHPTTAKGLLVVAKVQAALQASVPCDVPPSDPIACYRYEKARRLARRTA